MLIKKIVIHKADAYVYAWKQLRINMSSNFNAFEMPMHIKYYQEFWFEIKFLK